MSLQEVCLIVFVIGVGIYLLVTDKTIQEAARVVAAIAGILFGLLRIVT